MLVAWYKIRNFSFKLTIIKLIDNYEIYISLKTLKPSSFAFKSSYKKKEKNTRSRYTRDNDNKQKIFYVCENKIMYT